MTVRYLLSKVNTLGRGQNIACADSSSASGRRSIQLGVKGAGTVSAQVLIYGMNDGEFPVQLAQLDASGTDIATERWVDDFPWEFYMAELVSLSGTAAQVSVIVSV